MHIFTDTTGQKWDIAISTWEIERCRADPGVELLGLLPGQPAFEKFASDPVLIAYVAHRLIEDQADKLGIKRETFLRRMGGKATYDAAKAIVDEVVFFCPSEKQATLKKMLSKGREVELAMIAEADKQIDSVNPAELSVKLLNALATNSPESSASTPAAGPSDASSPPADPSLNANGSTPAPS